MGRKGALSDSSTLMAFGISKQARRESCQGSLSMSNQGTVILFASRATIPPNDVREVVDSLLFNQSIFFS